MIAASLTVACAPPLEPIPRAESRVLVHAVLDLGAEEQLVILERTEARVFDGIRIPGATVTIRTPLGEVVRGTEDPPDSSGALLGTVYRFPLSRQSPGVSPGGTFELRIETTTGDTVTGSTTMPNATPVVAQTYGGVFNRLTDTLRLQWARVPGAKGYQVGVYSELGVQGRSASVYTVFTDTTITIPGTAEAIESGHIAFPPGQPVTVVVAAVDENYHSYYRAVESPFGGAPPSRLNGGVGVFGSVVPLIMRQYNVR